MKRSTLLLISPIFSLIFFICTTVVAQNRVKVEEHSFLMKDPTGKFPMVVVHDSLVLKGFNFDQGHAAHLHPDMTMRGLGDYTFYLKGKSYVIDDGCGRVFEYTNEGFKRIDQSFNHRNQYGGAFFIYDQRPHLYGGYGFFTEKNILTNYHFDTKEWSLAGAHNRTNLPTFGTSFYYQDQDRLWITDKMVRSSNGQSVLNEAPSVYQISLSDLSCERLGNLSKRILETDWQKTFQRNGKLVILGIEELYELDFKNNLLEVFETTTALSIKDKVLYFPEKDYIATKIKTNGNFYALSIDYDGIKGRLLTSEPLYVAHKWLDYVMVAIALLFIAVIAYGLRKRYQIKKVVNDSLHYHTINQELKYNHQVWDALKDYRKQVLIHLIDAQRDFIPLSELDAILTTDESESYVTVKKRREHVLKDIAREIAALLSISKDEVLITRRSETDKRVKEIRLGITVIVKN